MIFNSFQFIWLFPIIFIVYWTVYKFRFEKLRKLPQYTLLLISYGLYLQWIPAYGLILFYVTFVTYFFAKFLHTSQKTLSKKRFFIYLSAILALGPLLIFKYYNFISHASASVLANIGIDIAPPGLNWIVPLGLSFYTFQALGYLWDVYYGKIHPERSFGNYMLFVAFFPQILCGPISSSSDLLPQIANPKKFEYERAVGGLRLILWGMFLKVVLADRIGIYVDTVYQDYEYYSGTTCLLTAVLYSFQIYGDFAGYSYMAVGVAKLLGFDLIYNFQRPYFATSVSQFWKRWNISLTKWLTAYVYIPLGGSRKGKLRTYLNILITFLVSGIWHGANYTFILWGGIHGIAQCIEKYFGWNNYQAKHRLITIIRILITFSIITIAWIYFRMPSIESGSEVIGKIISAPGTIYVSTESFLNIAIGFFIFIPIEFALEYKNHQLKSFLFKHSLLRWIGYMGLTTVIMLFGVLDSSQFIYVNF